MRSCRCFAITAVCIAATLAGCGSNNPLGRKPVVGKVTLNGVPLASGSIEFSPLIAGGVQSGALIALGNYAIPAEQGLPAGKYQVAISDSPAAPPLPPGHMPGDPLPPAPPPQVPAEWNRKSKHEIEVKKEGPNKFDFDIVTKMK
jgi:hypothetical protein